jgi:hypothetical protein
MPDPRPSDVQTFGGQHRWAIKYLMDWPINDGTVHPLQLHATVLRWFHEPQQRQEAVTRAAAWASPIDLTLPAPLQETITELEGVNIRVGAAYDAATFAFFLSLLTDGNLSTGGPFDEDFPKDWGKWRPAFPWLLTHWRRAFRNAPMPWPFFIFPGPSHPSPRDQ